MKNFSVEEVRETLSECEKVAIRIENPEIVQNIRETEEALVHSQNLRIAFIASDIKDLLRAADDLLHMKFSLSPLRPLGVVRSCCVNYTFGAEDKDEDFSELSSDFEMPTVINCMRSEKILNGMDVSMYLSLNEFTEFNWHRELERTDFVFLFTNATHMLNATERKFVDNCVRKYLGFERMAVVVTCMDYVQDVESYEELKELLKTYVASMNSSTQGFVQGEDDISGFIRANIMGNRENLIGLYTYQLTKVCVEDIEEAVLDMLRKSNMEVDKTENAKKILEEHRGDLLFYANITVKDALLEIDEWKDSSLTALDNFLRDMCRDICEVIDSSKDLDGAVEFANKHIQDSLKEFFEKQDKILGKKMEKYGQVLIEKMKEDAGKYFSNLSPQEFEFIDYVFLIFPLPKDEVELGESELREKVDKISKAMMIGSAPLLVFSIPIAAVSFVGSHVIKHVYQDMITEEYRENIKKQVKEICREMGYYWGQKIQNWFSTKSDEVRNNITRSYESFLQTLTNEVSKCAEEVKRASEKKEVLEQMKDFVIPELKARLI